MANSLTAVRGRVQQLLATVLTVSFGKVDEVMLALLTSLGHVLIQQHAYRARDREVSLGQGISRSALTSCEAR